MASGVPAESSRGHRRLFTHSHTRRARLYSSCFTTHQHEPELRSSRPGLTVPPLGADLDYSAAGLQEISSRRMPRVSPSTTLGPSGKHRQAMPFITGLCPVVPKLEGLSFFRWPRTFQEGDLRQADRSQSSHALPRSGRLHAKSRAPTFLLSLDIIPTKASWRQLAASASSKFVTAQGS